MEGDWTVRARAGVRGRCISRSGGWTTRRLTGSKAGVGTGSLLVRGIGRWRRSFAPRVLPVVELHGAPEVAQPHVYPDEQAIGRMAAEHLLDRGLRRLAFFAADETWWIKLRREAFARALAERGLHCNSCPGPSLA